MTPATEDDGAHVAKPVVAADGDDLPALPLREWAATLATLHRYAQVIGKIRLGATHPRNHWWNAALPLGSSGLLAPRMHSSGVFFDIELDLVCHELRVRTDHGHAERIGLRDGLSVAALFRELTGALARCGIRPAMRPVPFGIGDDTPFAMDEAHASYDPEAVGRYWSALSWAGDVLDEFASWFCGKASPVHVYWHSFDLAYTRFTGQRAASSPGTDPVTAEAYSHAVVSFGFWPGDPELGAPAFYSYTAPEPPDLTGAELTPASARWRTGGQGSLALLPYDAVRAATDGRQELLGFLESAFQAGASATGWDVPDLRTQWCPE